MELASYGRERRFCVVGMLNVRWPCYVQAELRMHYKGLLFVVFSDMKVLHVHFY